MAVSLNCAARVVRGLLFVSFLSAGQAYAQRPYEQEGTRVEDRFRRFRNQLDEFFRSLRAVVEREAPELASELDGAPPEPVIYGFQLLPEIVDTPVRPDAAVSNFSYSWPITAGYIENEGIRLARAEADLRQVGEVEPTAIRATLAKLIDDYRGIVRNQRTIDQYIQYNRFWQRSIAEDRSRFDRLTRLYEILKNGMPTAAAAVQEVLGRPDVPSFVTVVRSGANRTLLRIPIYTDIEDESYLVTAETAIEDMWRTSEGGMEYAVDVDIRRMAVTDLYPGPAVPQRGDHLDLRSHAGRFPNDGAVLTTGAETTHSLVGRYVALGPGELSRRTLAHEFGHLLGFRDGYIRGYRDLGPQGFEILELTAVFDDIMTAPRQGSVQAEHFKLILNEKR
jgi:hypothetical protein